jgi:hypothetical protein
VYKKNFFIDSWGAIDQGPEYKCARILSIYRIAKRVQLHEDQHRGEKYNDPNR